MHQCPKCNSDELHRSRPKTKWEAWRKQVTGKRPYRCHKCGHRWWAVDLGPRFGDEEVELATRAMAPEPPNLKGTALMRDEAQASVSLEELDNTLEPAPDKRQ
jgi:hypothetical protein